MVGAGYPQVFALAATVLTKDQQRQRATPVLRSGWSLAWAVGPLVGAALLGLLGYAGLFRASAIALLLTAAVVAVMPAPRANPDPSPPTDSGHQRTPNPVRRGLVPATASMVLVHCAMFAGSIALPLFVTRDLQRPATDVGLLFSVCAVVEIAAALALVWILPRISLPTLILIGIALFAAQFMITIVANSVIILLLAQLARGCAIAVVGTAGIQYFQSLDFQSLGSTSVGATTALFSNAGTAGSLISGLLGGGLVQWFGTGPALASCGALCVLAGLIFWAGKRVGSAPKEVLPTSGPDPCRVVDLAAPDARTAAQSDHSMQGQSTEKRSQAD